MAKVVINTCHGGFRLSNEAALLLAEKKNVRPVWYGDHYQWFLWDQPFGEPIDMTPELFERDQMQDISYIDRDDPDLVQVVETLGDEAGRSPVSSLKVVEVPDDVHWHIAEYDGAEWVAEDHRTWQ